MLPLVHKVPSFLRLGKLWSCFFLDIHLLYSFLYYNDFANYCWILPSQLFRQSWFFSLFEFSPKQNLLSIYTSFRCFDRCRKYRGRLREDWKQNTNKAGKLTFLLLRHSNFSWICVYTSYLRHGSEYSFFAKAIFTCLRVQLKLMLINFRWKI